MKKILLFAAAATLLAISCNKEDEVAGRPDYGNSNKEKTVFYASTESTATPQSGTKVYADEDLRVLWNENDYISIFNFANVNDKYMFDGEDGDNSGSFSFEEEGPDPSVPVDLDHIYAVYPYSTSAEASVEDSQVTIAVDLPAEQTYKEHSFGTGANTMVAVTDNNFLPFKNVCGYLKLRFYGDDVTLSSITLEGNNGEKIAGKAIVSPVADSNPAVAMDETATTIITLNCSEPVTLGTSSSDFTEFIFVVPPTTFSRGFKVIATTPDGGIFEKSSTRSLTISRNKIESMTAMKVTLSYDAFTITSIGSTSVGIFKKGSPNEITLEYRKGSGKWTAYEISSTIELTDGESLQFRSGEGGNANFSKNVSSYYKVEASGTGTIKVSGNITSLLDKDCVRSDVPEYAYCRLFASCVKLVDASKLILSATTLANYCYQRLFYGCTGLTSAPEELPATTLADYCYIEMFYGCTGLTSAPVLPATTLASYCYNQMFSGCTGLSTAPELPATTLKEECYSEMFSGCTRLTSAPELPATKMAKKCYWSMFSGCTGLTSAPELPATTLAGSCYAKMFLGCTGLTSAPEELPAMTMALWCYSEMFSGCTNLTSAPELPATALADNCYDSMFSGCIGLTSAPELPATTLAGYCYANMFLGCTGLTSAPELPATKMASTCYRGMFNGCIGLTSAPELPATTLANFCYNSMFYGCTGLTSAPELPATTLADYCYQDMFYGCTSLTSAPELPATTLAKCCYHYMFYGCTGLTSAPELPATTLAGYCYANMFYGCTRLNYIKMLATDVSADLCLYNWVSGVASTGTFVKNASATWDITGDSGIPSGWTVITE